MHGSPICGPAGYITQPASRRLNYLQVMEIIK